MRHLKNRADAQQALASGAPERYVSAALALIANLEEGYAEFGGWEPDEHGWVILLETPEDLDDLDAMHLSEPIGSTLWEEISEHADLQCFTLTVIMTNDFGMTLIAPFEILDPGLYQTLHEEARQCPPHPAAEGGVSV